MAKKKKRRAEWHQLTQEQRDRMEAFLDAGEKQVEIAKILKVDPGTVSREKKRRRLRGGRYDAVRAEEKARLKRKYSKFQGMKMEGSKDLKAYVIAGLKEKRSPDELAGRMRREKKLFYASKNAIYKWLYSIYGQRYAPLLCSKRYYPKKRKGPAVKRTMIPNRVGIAERPAGATNKTRYGHFEGDTIVAPKKALNTEGVAIAVERISKFLLAKKIASQSPAVMRRAVQTMRQGAEIDTMTLDNGIENKHHEQWGMPTFFADAHSPWQKPVVEGSIGLARRWFFPKGTDWATVSDADLRKAIDTLNNKYRKSLKYQNAIEVAMAHGIIKKKSTKKSKKKNCN